MTAITFETLLEKQQYSDEFICMLKSTIGETWKAQQKAANDVASAATKHLEELERKLGGLEDMRATGEISRERFASRKAELEGQIDDANRSVLQSVHDDRDLDGHLEYYLFLLGNTHIVWHQEDTRGKKAIQQLLFRDGIVCEVVKVENVREIVLKRANGTVVQVQVRKKRKKVECRTIISSAKSMTSECIPLQIYLAEARGSRTHP